MPKKTAAGVTAAVIVVLGAIVAFLTLTMRRADSADLNSTKAVKVATDAQIHAEVNTVRIEGVQEDVLRLERQQKAIGENLDTKLDKVLDRLPE